MKLIFISLPGLSLRVLKDSPGCAPRLEGLIERRVDRVRALVPVEPAYGAASQASLLTGVLPQDHGVCASPVSRGLEHPTFWQRIQKGRPDFSVASALWEPTFELDTPGFERATFPGNHSNGERILEMVSASTACDLVAFRMAGISHAVRRSGPDSSEVRRRLTSIDRVLGGVIETADSFAAEICICGEYAVTPCHQVCELNLPGVESIEIQGQLAHLWGNAEKIENAAKSCTGVAQIYSGKRREQIGLNCASAGDVVVVAQQGVSFEQSAGCVGLRQQNPLDQGALIMTKGLIAALEGELKARVGVCELSWFLQRALTSEAAKK